ncbi:hypothetical protein J3Q64DRAFT_1704409 [Phycomyces blakesleeanus]|uniref:Uncharacterized protein n=2 Tax=Phycomyces blakesleeanus TaxID=4837 RepID=A0A162N497_PHYB8|nr:hypothetical protein PHYBLDRAFT_175888 [Phycomyces blakesleeanus NRRL 1555(-)]OAD65714.1 hypothetical protein PHYBLDRAFT_175888 [Phycomyces blakesleeanus NRRL 1555(-)]|eukprot:XP_018283754.1 hypothetical protein PHYBLDRAFT_175888 [Phycomyces blakesleeanus NRRL 1555(-)]
MHVCILNIKFPCGIQGNTGDSIIVDRISSKIKPKEEKDSKALITINIHITTTITPTTPTTSISYLLSIMSHLPELQLQQHQHQQSDSALEKNISVKKPCKLFDLPVWIYLVCIALILGIFLTTSVTLLLNKSKNEANRYEDNIITMAIDGHSQDPGLDQVNAALQQFTVSSITTTVTKTLQLSPSPTPLSLSLSLFLLHSPSPTSIHIKQTNT